MIANGAKCDENSEAKDRVLDLAHSIVSLVLTGHQELKGLCPSPHKVSVLFSESGYRSKNEM